MNRPIFDRTLPRYATCKNVTRTPIGSPFCSQSRFMGDFPCGDCEAYEPYPFPVGSRATIEQAPKLEEAFIHFGIRITRMDLLYDVKTGESLIDYMDRRGGKE